MKHTSPTSYSLFKFVTEQGQSSSRGKGSREPGSSKLLRGTDQSLVWSHMCSRCLRRAYQLLSVNDQTVTVTLPSLHILLKSVASLVRMLFMNNYVCKSTYCALICSNDLTVDLNTVLIVMCAIYLLNFKSFHHLDTSLSDFFTGFSETNIFHERCKRCSPVIFVSYKLYR